MDYTREQAYAIRLQGENIMVSAGAGAGKTRVLVDRLVDRILDRDHPVSADQFLLMTFTEAAASEMRERIGKTLEDHLDRDPENTFLQAQIRKIRHADICTIHGFCSRLIRARYNELGLDPSFRIGEEGELALMKEEAMADLLEENYAQGPASFVSFAEAYSPGRNDKRLEDLVKSLYNFTRAFPDARGWLDRMTSGGREAERQISMILEDHRMRALFRLGEERKELEEILDYGEACGLTESASHRLAGQLADIIRTLEKAESLDDFVRELRQADDAYPAKRGMKKEDKKRPDLPALYAIHESLKKQIKDLSAGIFSMTREEILDQRNQQEAFSSELARLTLRYEQLYDEKKMKKNVYDFNDLERFALRLLVRGYDDSGEPVPTETAEELAGSYREIFVDEYQDVNLIQETIVKVLYRPGFNHLFTVGDVKQSIYRFRQARPDLFLSRSRSYMPVDDYLALGDPEAGKREASGKEKRSGDPARSEGEGRPDSEGRSEDEVRLKGEGRTEGEAESEGEVRGVEIRLLDNFRSSPAVIDTVNYIFRQLMDRDFGGMDYDDRTALRCGRIQDQGEEADGPLPARSEMNLFIRDDEFESLTDGPEVILAETAMIGSRIEKLVGEGYEYSDIVILLRSVKDKARVMADYLDRCGIPTLCQNQTGYFETMEIRIMMNYLSVIDNVYQDYPMASVMMSSIGGFTVDDMVRLRILRGKGEGVGYFLYDLMVRYRDMGRGKEKALMPVDQDLLRKIENFLDLLHAFREKKKETPLPVLLWDIYQKTGFYYDVQLMKEGENRKQNLLMFLEKARDYEQTAYKGLFYFNRYMKQLKTYEVDLGIGGQKDGSMNRVRIMTIHKSKGLEFPVVFVSNLSGLLNLQDTRASAVFHPELGIGLEYRDPAIRIRHKSFMQRVIADRMKKESLEEELRVLYVAMTRACDKLILTGTIKEKDLEKIRKPSPGLPDKEKAQSYMNWLLPAVAANPSMRAYLESRGLDSSSAEDRTDLGTDNRTDHGTDSRTDHRADHVTDHGTDNKTDGKGPGSGEAESLEVVFYHWNQLTDWFAEEEEGIQPISWPEFLSLLGIAAPESGEEEKEDTERVRRSFSYEYPYQMETGWKRKYSVSDLKKGSDGSVREEAGQEEGILALSQESVPLFALPDSDLSASQRGTLVHKVMELLPFDRIRDQDQLRREVEAVVEAYPQAGSLDLEDLLPRIGRFLFSKQGEDLALAQKEGRLHKETPFTIGLPADRVYPGTDSAEMVIIQGVIDLYCEGEDGLWLIDYKTDRLREGEGALLLDRYKAQMLYYKTALEQITEKTVSRIDLYSFTLGQFIPVTF